MLRLETKTKTLLVNQPAFSGDAAVQKITAVKLKPGFGSPHLHDAATDGLIGPGCKRKLARGAVEHPVVIVASTKSKLLILLVDPRSNDCRPGEIHWRVLYASQFARRYEPRIN